jgi:hypothetical protein
MLNQAMNVFMERYLSTGKILTLLSVLVTELVIAHDYIGSSGVLEGARICQQWAGDAESGRHKNEFQHCTCWLNLQRDRKKTGFSPLLSLLCNYGNAT